MPADQIYDLRAPLECDLVPRKMTNPLANGPQSFQSFTLLILQEVNGYADDVVRFTRIS